MSPDPLTPEQLAALKKMIGDPVAKARNCAPDAHIRGYLAVLAAATVGLVCGAGGFGIGWYVFGMLR